MTPMIDVTFLLIIFFLLAGQLTRQQVQVQLDLPGATTSHRPDDQRPRIVLVNVPASGEILLSGEAVRVDEFRQRIEIEREKAVGRPLEVRIRADRTVPYRQIEPLLLACARSGIWNVSFAVLREGGR